MPSPTHKARVSSTSLSRSSTGDAIRRGDLKISEPIPIPREGKEGLGPQTGVGITDFQPSPSRRRDVEEGAWSRIERTVPADDPRSSTREGGSTTHRATAYNTTTRISDSNLHGSISSGPSRDLRKTYGLKATFRKIFRRKDRRYTVEGVKEQPSPSGPNIQSYIQHSPTRISSLPIHSVNQASALGSHSPLAPFERHDQNERRREGQESGSRRRRNTLPSVIFSPQEEQALRDTLGEGVISQRGKTRLEQENRPLINHPNRRSRSADALRETTDLRRISPIQWRRRSGEVKNWHFPRAGDGPLNETQTGDQREEFSRPVTRGSNTIRRLESAAPPPPPIGTHTIHPAQSFDFGPLLVPGSDDSASVEQRVTTIEVKLIDLEYAIAKLQGYDIAKPAAIVGSSQETQAEHDLPPQQASAQSQLSSPSHQLHPQATFLSSPQDSPNPSHEDEDNHGSRPQRASGAPTLRPLTAFHQPSSSTLSYSSSHPRPNQNQPQPLISDTFSYSHLLTLIQTEQSARRTLELQLQKLQREVGELRLSPQGNYSPQNTYPTPSPESVSQEYQTSVSVRRIQTVSNPSVPRSVDPSSRHGSGSTSGAELPRAQFREPLREEIQPPEFQSAFDDRSDDGTETDDDGYTDVYETPTETREGYVYGKMGSSEAMRQQSAPQIQPKPPNYLTMI